ncbi:hypothetical protein KEM56_001798 [Ascosphaera pollenicola]|nr:hypothetical protein KEM56_001798 [Ascosphaera pollenicola]
MPHTPLTSHHLNYLIWRYLQESGLGEAATLLQRHWMFDPQSLPFAPFVKTHALVTLVQKGLQYWELEKSITKSGDITPISPDTSFFGPDVEDLTATEQSSEDQSKSASSKQMVESNGHVDTTTTEFQATRAVQSVEGGDKLTETTAEVTGETIVDDDGDIGMLDQVENMPQEVFTLAAGQSTGVQIAPAKAMDLAPQTTVLDIPDTDGAILKSAWRPQDPTTLAVYGNNFCGLWKSPSGRWSGSSATYHSLVESHADEPAAVTAMAWNADGTLLAVATYTRMMGTITLYGPTGEVFDALPDTPSMVSNFSWAPHGLRLVVVMSDPHKSQLALWDQAVKAKEFSHIYQVNSHIYDVAWPEGESVFALGDKSMHMISTRDDMLELSQVFSTENKKDSWSLLCATTVSGEPLAVAASTQNAKLYIPTHDLVLDDIHAAAITSVQACPLSLPDVDVSRNVLLMTSSMDGTLKLWRLDLESKESTCLHRLSLTSTPTELTSSVSPDSYAVAGASLNKLSVWNVERGGIPMAKLSVPFDANDKDLQGDGGVQSEATKNGPQRSLTWDSDSKRLALSFNRRIAVVDFQR